MRTGAGGRDEKLYPAQRAFEQPAFGRPQGRRAGPAQSPAEQVCPNCGYTLEKFQEKAVLGCPNDYEVFEKQLSPLIKKAHDGATCHCGKVPANTPTDSKKQLEITQLRRQLDEAVRKEDYELAAKLRDKLAEFK